MVTRVAFLDRSARSTSLALVALGGALGFVCGTTPADAAEDKTIDSALSAGGALTFHTLTITSKGTLSVLPYVAGSTTSTGVLDITADTIIVNQGGAISADGAGYQGVDQAAGACASTGSCAQAGSMAGFPGGGGGFFAAGGNGTSETTAGTCLDLHNGALGGMAVYTLGAIVLGSAGGSGNLDAHDGAPGGAGGGYIRLSAAVIQIDGAVHANGASPESPHYGGVGPGGGSGGVIEITAAFLRGAGTLAVNGGNGAHGMGLAPSGTPNNGGGGAGGVILLHLPPTAPNPLTTTNSGGMTGDCVAPTTPAGLGTQQSAAMTSSCVDLDMDGYASALCGGNDCDDTDPAIHPGAGTCLMADAGTMNDGGPSRPSPPEYIQYGGGCAVGPRDSEGLAALGFGFLIALGGVALGRVRRR